MEEYSKDLVKQMDRKGLLDKKQREDDARYITEKERENKRIADNEARAKLEHQNKVKQDFDKGNHDLLEKKKRSIEV